MGVFACQVCGNPDAYNSHSPAGMVHRCPGRPPWKVLQWDDSLPKPDGWALPNAAGLAVMQLGDCPSGWRGLPGLMPVWLKPPVNG